MGLKAVQCCLQELCVCLALSCQQQQGKLQRRKQQAEFDAGFRQQSTRHALELCWLLGPAAGKQDSLLHTQHTCLSILCSASLSPTLAVLFMQLSRTTPACVSEGGRAVAGRRNAMRGGREAPAASSSRSIAPQAGRQQPQQANCFCPSRIAQALAHPPRVPTHHQQSLPTLRTAAPSYALPAGAAHCKQRSR